MRVNTIIGLVIFVALLWIITIADDVANLELARFGITPRDASSLIGIPLHVFIHGGIWHVLANTVPLLMMGGLIALRDSAGLLMVSIFIVLVGGSGLWLIGREASHVGASGLVFGYFGYLVARGFSERNCLSFIIALIVAALYGLPILFGIIPTGGITSWEGHLTGLLAGILCAWLFTSLSKPDNPNEQRRSPP